MNTPKATRVSLNVFELSDLEWCLDQQSEHLMDSKRLEKDWPGVGKRAALRLKSLSAKLRKAKLAFVKRCENERV